jgi:hypothetical protein
MAEEIRAVTTGGNGERMEVRLGTRSFGVTTRDLVPILLLIMMGAGGYLLYTNVMGAVERIATGQARLQEAMHENRQTIMQNIDDWHRMIQVQNDNFRRLLQVHDFNQDRAPAERLPLEGVPPEQLPSRAPRAPN